MVATAPLSALFIAGPELGTPSPLLADKWDPQRRDYASLEEGDDPVDAHVLHAICVIRGSGASVLDTGIDTPPPTMLDSLEQEVAASVRLALSRLIESGDIRLKRVGIRNRIDGQQFAEAVVEYINLRTGRDQNATVPLRSGIAA